MEIEDNIQWHPAFCSAMELELRENKKDLQYIREYNLSKMPLKIDFLIIKKKPKVIIQNEIGECCIRSKYQTIQENDTGGRSNV